MSIFEQLQGRLGSQSRQPVEQKLTFSEREPKSSVFLQYAFFPDNQAVHVASLKPMVQEFFATDSSDNIFVLDSPMFLGALDLPHFYAWIDRENGNYFEGFVQHCATSENGKPLSKEELDREREIIELIDHIDANDAQNIHGNIPWQAVGEQVFIGKMMLMFDELKKNEKISFRLAIQPLSKRDIGRMLKKDPNEENLDESGDDDRPVTLDNLEEVIEETKVYYEKKLRNQTYVLAFKNKLFIPFLHSVINEALRNTGNTRIFVPRPYVSYFTDYQEIKEASKDIRSISNRSPLFINCGEYPNVEDILTAKFMKNPMESLTRAETVQLMSISLLQYILNSAMHQQLTQFIPEAIAKSTPAELIALLKKIYGSHIPPTDEELGIDPSFSERAKKILRSLGVIDPTRIATDFVIEKTSGSDE